MLNGTKEKNGTANRTVVIQPASHKRARLAANLTRRTLIDFLSEAADKLSAPILRKHGIDSDKLAG